MHPHPLACPAPASGILEVVQLIVAELGPALSGTAPTVGVEETEEDARFLAEERKLKLTQAVDVLHGIVTPAASEAELQAKVQKLCSFAADPATAFILDYDDIKHAHVPLAL